MNRVAAKVAEEVAVLLEHDDVDAGAGEQKPEDRTGRTAARYRSTSSPSAHAIAVAVYRRTTVEGGGPE